MIIDFVKVYPTPAEVSMHEYLLAVSCLFTTLYWSVRLRELIVFGVETVQSCFF